MILDGLKEQPLGNFKRKLREVDCDARQTEPYSPWQQAAEGCIRELKRGVSRKIRPDHPRFYGTTTLSLKLLFAPICNDIYMTNGKVPETIMTGTTADISHICKFTWFDWVISGIISPHSLTTN
jgi:hypothetical protein